MQKVKQEKAEAKQAGAAKKRKEAAQAKAQSLKEWVLEIMGCRVRGRMGRERCGGKVQLQCVFKDNQRQWVDWRDASVCGNPQLTFAFFEAGGEPVKVKSVDIDDIPGVDYARTKVSLLMPMFQQVNCCVMMC